MPNGVTPGAAFGAQMNMFNSPKEKEDDLGDIKKELKEEKRSLGEIIKNTLPIPAMQSGFKQDISTALGLSLAGPMFPILREIADFGPVRDRLSQLYNIGKERFKWMKEKLFGFLWFLYRSMKRRWKQPWMDKLKGIPGSLLKLGKVLGPLAGGALIALDALKGYKKAGVAGAIGYGLGGEGDWKKRMGVGAAKGALAGMMFGPLGMAIGAASGALLGAIGGERITKALQVSGKAIKDAYEWFDVNVMSPFIDWCRKLWNDPGKTLKEGIEWFKTDVLGPTTEFFRSMLHIPGKILKESIEWFRTSVLEGLDFGINIVGSKISEMAISIKDAFLEKVDWLKEELPKMLGNAFSKVKDWIVGFPGMIWKAIDKSARESENWLVRKAWTGVFGETPKAEAVPAKPGKSSAEEAAKSADYTREMAVGFQSLATELHQLNQTRIEDLRRRERERLPVVGDDISMYNPDPNITISNMLVQ